LKLSGAGTPDHHQERWWRINFAIQKLLKTFPFDQLVKKLNLLESTWSFGPARKLILSLIQQA
jgi:hypothetical protein